MAKSKLQKRKDSPKSKYWKTKADALWGKIIHHLYPRCAVGETGYSAECNGRVEAHHLISRANTATRHCIENGIGICSIHHKWSNKLSAHGAPLAFAEWLQNNHPERWEWHGKNKFAVAKPNYQQAFEDLEAWCEANAPELL